MLAQLFRKRFIFRLGVDELTLIFEIFIIFFINLQNAFYEIKQTFIRFSIGI